MLSWIKGYGRWQLFDKKKIKSPFLFVALLVSVFAAEVAIFYYTRVDPSMTPALKEEKKVYIKLSSIKPAPPKPVCECTAQPKAEPKPKPFTEPKPKPKPKPVVKPKPKPKPVVKPKPKPKPKPPEKRIVKQPQPVEVQKQIAKEPVKKPVKRVEKVVSKPATKPVVSAQRVDTQKIERIKAEYLKAVREEIERNKYYPRSARKLHQTGIVEVEFVILKDGTIEKIALHSPCRHKRLNKAALRTLEKIGNFKPLPDVFESGELVLKIPINYKLKTR